MYSGKAIRIRQLASYEPLRNAYGEWWKRVQDYYSGKLGEFRLNAISITGKTPWSNK